MRKAVPRFTSTRRVSFPPSGCHGLTPKENRAMSSGNPLLPGRPIRNLFRIASGAGPGAVLLVLVLWAEMGVAAETAAELLVPRSAPAQSEGQEDADDDPRGYGPCRWRWTVGSPQHDRGELDFPRRQLRRRDHCLRLPRPPVSIPSAGGDATQLASGMAFDAQPRFEAHVQRAASAVPARGYAVEHGDRYPRSSRYGRPCSPPCRRTVGGWCSARGTMSTRGRCCAPSGRGRGGG